MIQLSIATASIIIFYFGVLFALACQKRNFAIADIGWGLGFVFIAFYCQFTTASISFFSWLVTGLVTLWGLRLSLYLYVRSRQKPEDFRYKKLREKWARFVRVQTFFKVYIPQAFIMWVISTAMVIATITPVRQLNILSWIFCATALFGLFYESISDYQLSQFKRNPGNHGKIMKQGLWRYSRHPNYFGEVVFWWSISLLVSVSTGNYLALVSGAVINLVIVYVSGIPMIEDKYKDNEAYEEYVNTTNAVIPGTPEVAEAS